MPAATHNCSNCVMSFRVTCCLLISLQLIYFFCSIFLFSSASTRAVISFTTEPSFFTISTSWYGYCYRCHPSNWTFYFQGSGFPLSVIWSWSGSVCKAHIALQEFQGAAMMLHRMSFQKVGKMVALHLNKSTANTYLCNQSGVVSLFFPDWPAWYWVWPMNTVLLLFQNTFLSHQWWSWLFVMGMVAFGVASSSWYCPSSILVLQSTRGGSVGIITYHSMSALLHLGKCTASAGLEVEYIQPSFDISGKL